MFAHGDTNAGFLCPVQDFGQLYRAQACPFLAMDKRPLSPGPAFSFFFSDPFYVSTLRHTDIDPSYGGFNVSPAKNDPDAGRSFPGQNNDVSAYCLYFHVHQFPFRPGTLLAHQQHPLHWPAISY